MLLRVWGAPATAEAAGGDSAADQNTFALSPDGTRLAMTGSGSVGGAAPVTAGGREANTVKVVDVATGARLALLRGHTNSVLCVAYSPDGKTIATASWYGGGCSRLVQQGL